MSTRLSNQRAATCVQDNHDSPLADAEEQASVEEPGIDPDHPFGSGWPQPAHSRQARERLA